MRPSSVEPGFLTHPVHDYHLLLPCTNQSRKLLQQPFHARLDDRVMVHCRLEPISGDTVRDSLKTRNRAGRRSRPINRQSLSAPLLASFFLNMKKSKHRAQTVIALIHMAHSKAPTKSPVTGGRNKQDVRQELKCWSSQGQGSRGQQSSIYPDPRCD
jgi:hypothetical protein